MRQLLPSNQPKPEPSTSPNNKTALAPTIITATLSALCLIGVVSLLPRLGFLTATKQTVGLAPTTVTMQENQQDNSTMSVLWDAPVSQPQFWYNNRLVNATCNSQTCTVPKPNSTNQVYFRWLNTTDNQWYYFTCNGDYRGTFQGIAYSQ
jgi:heme-binding NEAT domain protein